MAIETLQSHVLMAMQFKDDLPNLWYGMAQETPWPDEEIPPTEDLYTSELGGLIGLKKFDKAQLVVPITASGESDTITGNEVVYKSQSWEIVSDDQAMEKANTLDPRLEYELKDTLICVFFTIQFSTRLLLKNQ